MHGCILVPISDPTSIECEMVGHFIEDCLARLKRRGIRCSPPTGLEDLLKGELPLPSTLSFPRAIGDALGRNRPSWVKHIRSELGPLADVRAVGFCIDTNDCKRIKRSLSKRFPRFLIQHAFLFPLTDYPGVFDPAPSLAILN